MSSKVAQVTTGGSPPTFGAREELAAQRSRHALAIMEAGEIEQALASGALPQFIDTTLSEVIVLGLLRQGLRSYVGVLGHGSTEIGEVLRIYEDAGLVRTYAVRSEVEASHAAALRWVTGEKAAVLTSIGPGALHALAASIVPASDGLGVWYLFGDETTEDEGPNMQQIPGHEQGRFHRLCSTMGRAYSMHTPLAVAMALRRGLNTVDHPHRPGPFYLLLPMNTQGSRLRSFNLDELPRHGPPRLGAAAGDYVAAAQALMHARRVVVKIGGGARDVGPELLEFLELVDGVAVTSPLVSGIVPYDHQRNMSIGGSKGTQCGNYAMESADLLVAIATRFVCQSDSSRTGYPKVERIININTDLEDANHYGRSIAMVGDAGPTLTELNRVLRWGRPKVQAPPSAWLTACREQRVAWEAFKSVRYSHPTLFDVAWGREVLTQPAAIKAAVDWARAHDVVVFFDAGDVQANGMQIVEDDRLGRTYTESGASYMGFAASALLATALSEPCFYGLALSGDGSFSMNPQILIDGVEHGARGCILLLDNRRMAAISGLQRAQYGEDRATNDSVEVDYIAWARSVHGVEAFDGGNSIASLVLALDRALCHEGISLVHVGVYFGEDDLGGLGAFGRWNVGNWCEETQALRHTIGL